MRTLSGASVVDEHAPLGERKDWALRMLGTYDSQGQGIGIDALALAIGWSSFGTTEVTHALWKDGLIEPVRLGPATSVRLTERGWEALQGQNRAKIGI